MKTEQQIRTECSKYLQAYNNGEHNEWTLPDEMIEDLAEIREKNLPLYEANGNKIAETLSSMLSVGFISGKHNAQFTKPNSLREYLEETTNVKLAFRVEESDPQYDNEGQFYDYPVYNFYVEYDTVRAAPSFNLAELANFLGNTASLSLNDSGIFVNGEFNGEFCQIRIHWYTRDE